MRLFAVPCFGVMIAALVAGGSSKDSPAPEGPKLDYVNRQGHFAMNLPKGWAATEVKATDVKGMIAVLIKAPNNASGESAANIVAGVMDPPPGVRLYFDDMIAGAREKAQGLPGYKAISEKTVTLPDGNKGWVLTCQSSPKPDGPVVQQRMMQVLANNRCYTMVATAAAGNFADMEASFDVSFSSFRVSW